MNVGAFSCQDSEPDLSRSRLENLKYYISLVLGTLCIVCIFAFLFLVPFVLDPAISTLMHKVLYLSSKVTNCPSKSVCLYAGENNFIWNIPIPSSSWSTLWCAK